METIEMTEVDPIPQEEFSKHYLQGGGPTKTSNGSLGHEEFMTS